YCTVCMFMNMEAVGADGILISLCRLIRRQACYFHGYLCPIRNLHKCDVPMEVWSKLASSYLCKCSCYLLPDWVVHLIWMIMIRIHIYISSLILGDTLFYAQGAHFVKGG